MCSTSRRIILFLSTAMLYLSFHKNRKFSALKNIYIYIFFPKKKPTTMKKTNRKMATSMDEINATVQVVFRSNYRNNSTCICTLFDMWKNHQLQLASNLILTLFGLMFAP